MELTSFLLFFRARLFLHTILNPMGEIMMVRKKDRLNYLFASQRVAIDWMNTCDWKEDEIFVELEKKCLSWQSPLLC